MWDFEHGRPPADGASPRHRVDPGLAEDFEVTYTIPSRCADQLAAGEADIGIIPVVAYALIPNLVIVPGVSISSQQDVRSILLVSKVPLAQIQSVALDTASRTSVALLRVLFAKHWGAGRSFVPMEADLRGMLEHCDAGLIIGDPALQVDRSRYFTFDLAEEWKRFTGKPFVFAVWAMRLAAMNERRAELDVAEVFQRSRDHGLEPAHLAGIAQNWAPHLGLRQEEITSYLTHHIDYSLGSDNLAGLDLFFRYAAECGIIPASPQLRFLVSGSGVRTVQSLRN